MQSGSEQPELEGWQRFVGTWATETTHPLLPATVVHGQCTFEWLEGRRFVIQHSHHDHSEIPDAMRSPASPMGSCRCITSTTAASTGCTQLASAKAPGGSGATRPASRSAFTGTFGDDGDTIAGQGELSRNGENWEDDLAITYRRVA
jgi:hypothetical protein